jgi:hypothetical protein
MRFSKHIGLRAAWDMRGGYAWWRGQFLNVLRRDGVRAITLRTYWAFEQAWSANRVPLTLRARHFLFINKID